MILANKFWGVSCCCSRMERWNKIRATPFILATHFAKRSTKFGGGEGEGGTGIHFSTLSFFRLAQAFHFNFSRALRSNYSRFCSK